LQSTLTTIQQENIAIKQAEAQKQLEIDKTKRQLIDEKQKINEFKTSL
jgi:hypothetical protein